MNPPNTLEPDGTKRASSPLPSLYLGHGAPPLLEDEAWMAELKGWAEQLPRPKQILIVSAHWQSAPEASVRPVASRWCTTSTASPSTTTV